MPTEMLIGEFADAAGVGIQTVRFYARRGLLSEPPRSDAGYRLYDTDALRRLRFIRKAKQPRFTLEETKELLALRVPDASVCDDVAERTRRKLRIVEDGIRDLGPES